MRSLLALILLAAMAWAGYWFVGKTGLDRAFPAWFEARRAEGWVAEAAQTRTRGFPNRFDTTFTDIRLADPETGLAWDAPVFQLLVLSYKPNHVIAVWPETQRIATPLAKYRIKSADMRASLVTDAGSRLPLRRAVLTAKRLAITREGNARPIRAETLRLAAERQPTAPATYRIGLAADGLSPALDWRTRLDPAGRLPDRFDAFKADLSVAFDKPWDRLAIEEARPQPRRIDIELAEARWGRLELQAAGKVTVDAAGQPEGDIMVKARNWRDILQMAVASGRIGDGFATTLADALTLISQMAGNPRTLDIPLKFSGGRVRLGPVPLGPAPVLRIR